MSKTSAKLLKAKLNIPVALMLSVVPDIDILVPFIEHRGPTHSFVMASIVFIPIFAIYHKKAIPYFVALIQHSLVGDYITGSGIRILWPLTTQYYGIGTNIWSQTNITIEWIMFLTSIIIMLKTKETTTFFQPHNSNLILSIPTFTLLLPTFLSLPLNVPTWLTLPHLVYMSIFSASIITSARDLFKTRRKSNSSENFSLLKSAIY